MSRVSLYIGTELADFNEAFNVLFSIGDIRDLSFGNTNRSYTLNLPLTKTNKRLLKFINQVDVKSEPSDLGRMYLYEMLIISGNIKVIGSDDYYAKIIISSDEWIDSLKNARMVELDLSSHDHALNNANVEDSWTASYPAYRYPMINFGGLVSGEYGSSANWYPNDFIPMISLVTIINKMLEPYTVSSSWIGTSFVKDLFILAREVISNDNFIRNKNLEVAVALVSDNYDTETILAFDTSLAWLNAVNCIFDTETQDEGNDWSTDTYTVPEDGTYRFKASLTLYNDAPANPNVTINTETVTISIIRDRAAVETVLASVTAGAYTGTELINDIIYPLDTLYWDMEAGDTVFVRLNISCNATNDVGSSQDISIGVLNSVSTFENVWGLANKYAGIGKNISLEEMLPDMLQIDFLAAIKDLFNLRFWTDKNRQVIYIEPWDSFVSSTVVNLTQYVDYENIPSELISKNYYKTIRLKFKDDESDDAYNEYLKLNEIGPGYKDISMTSLFAKDGEEVREHPFSSLITGWNASISEYTTDTPRIWNTVPIAPFNMFDRKTGFNTRIVEWKGLTAGISWYYEGVNKTTYPKIEGLDFASLYSDYWLKLFHYIDKGKILPVRMKINPAYLTQFMTVVDTAVNEGFRPTYKITIKGIDNYFFMQSITTDGEMAEIELILKQ